MEMKQYLLDTFRFNDQANKMILMKMQEPPDESGVVRFFSRLINSRYKWMARIVRDPHALEMDWWEPVYSFENLEGKWINGLQRWIDYLSNRTEGKMYEERRFAGFDGGEWTAPLKYIALQLNYHSTDHRAQIQTMIRAQGLESDFIDYIGMVYRKLS